MTPGWFPASERLRKDPFRWQPSALQQARNHQRGSRTNRRVPLALTPGLAMLLVLFIVGYGVPGLQLQGAPQSTFVLGISALVLTYSAYVAEVFRAGINSVHPSQRAAARSLGLTHGQTMRHVVFPQAVRRVLPPLLNDFVSLQKDTSLVSILGVIDIVLTATNDT